MLRFLRSRDNSDRLGANAKMQLNVVSAPREAVTRLEIYVCRYPYTYEYLLLLFLSPVSLVLLAHFAVIFGICHSQVMIICAQVEQGRTFEQFEIN